MKKFCDICNLKYIDYPTNGGGDHNLTITAKLSELMQESHSSLKYLYECSHPNLDRLVELTQNFGIRGVRLTGAGYVVTNSINSYSINYLFFFLICK